MGAVTNLQNLGAAASEIVRQRGDRIQYGKSGPEGPSMGAHAGTVRRQERPSQVGRHPRASAHAKMLCPFGPLGKSVAWSSIFLGAKASAEPPEVKAEGRREKGVQSQSGASRLASDWLWAGSQIATSSCSDFSRQDPAIHRASTLQYRHTLPCGHAISLILQKMEAQAPKFDDGDCSACDTSTSIRQPSTAAILRTFVFYVSSSTGLRCDQVRNLELRSKHLLCCLMPHRPHLHNAPKLWPLWFDYRL